jgi:hypothetical protein
VPAEAFGQLEQGWLPKPMGQVRDHQALTTTVQKGHQMIEEARGVPQAVHQHERRGISRGDCRGDGAGSRWSRDCPVPDTSARALAHAPPAAAGIPPSVLLLCGEGNRHRNRPADQRLRLRGHGWKLGGDPPGEEGPNVAAEGGARQNRAMAQKRQPGRRRARSAHKTSMSAC